MILDQKTWSISTIRATDMCISRSIDPILAHCLSVCWCLMLFITHTAVRQRFSCYHVPNIIRFMIYLPSYIMTMNTEHVGL